MILSENEKKIRNKLYLIMAIAGVALYSLYSFLILPLYMDMGVKADIGLMEPIFPELMDLLGKTVETLTISVLCAVIVYGIYLFGVKGFRGGLFIFAGLSTYKYVCNVVADWISSRYIPSDFGWDMLLALINTVAEMIPFVIVLISVIITYKRSNLKECDENGRRFVSFKQLFDLSDFLVASTLYCSLIVLTVKLVGRMINDIQSILAYGFPQEAATYGLMALNYALSILYAVFCYFVMLLTVSVISDKFNISHVKNQ